MRRLAGFGASALAAVLVGTPPLPPPAPAIPVDEGSAFTGIARVGVGDTCTASLIDTGVDDAPAYLLTNGHCAGARNTGSNDVLLDDDATGDAVFGAFAGGADGLVVVPIIGVPYSTMKGLDVSVVELALTLGEARAAGLHPLAIAADPPVAGAAVVNVGIPVQSLDSSDWVLRRGRCTLGDRVDLLEFVWHFDGSWSNDCPGIRGGSSGSPLLSDDGSIVAMINTTTAGAHPVGGDCYLGKPCEVGLDGVDVVLDRSYAVPVAGVERCFVAGVFEARAPRCPLDPGGGVAVRIDQRAVMPAEVAGAATTTAVVTGPFGAVYVTKFGPAGTTDCEDPAGYGTALPVIGELAVTVGLPTTEGMYLLCVAGPGDEEHAAVAVVQVDSTPPMREPELSVRDLGDAVLIEPIFSVPELSDFAVKIGPAGAVDCADEEGYARYRRIPFDVAATDLPVTVCVIGSDEAGNAGAPFEQLIEPGDQPQF